MSKKHADEIMALTKALQTDRGQSQAFSFLLGVLSAMADDGRPVSATRLVKAALWAVESASKNPAEERARAQEAWRAAEEAELPEPRDVPELDPTHFSHAMTGIGRETSWCGAPGRVAVLASSVTCPVCRRMLSQEEAGDQGARTRTLAVSPLADGTSASDETAQAEIVIGEARYGDAELDGLACILCHQEFAVGEASVPAGVVDGGPQVFAHRLCLETLHAPMPGNATRLTRCLIPLISENGARTALNTTDVTCVACLEEIKKGERRTGRVAQLRTAIRPLAEPKREGQEELVTAEAEAVIEEWTPGPELRAKVEADRAALPALAAAVINGSTPRRLWVHSGSCIYCAHGPACVTCDLTQGPYWGIDRFYPGPVCDRCAEECKRLEIAADPYYSGDYVTMFGDDE